MNYSFELFLIFNAISAITSLVLAIYLLSRREAPGALFLAFAEFACAIWTIGYIIELSGITFDVKMIGVKIQYIFGIPFVPYFWYAAARHITTSRQRPSKIELIIVGIIPLITMVMAQTVEHHSYFYIEPHLKIISAYSLIEKGRGVWFLVNIFYSYFLLVTATVLLLNSLRKVQTIFRTQTLFLLLGISLPWISNILYVTGMNSFMRIDLTNLSFTFAAILFTWSIHRFELFKLIPLAKDAIIESLRTGLIVMDPDFRVVDYNRTAIELFGNNLAVGSPADSVLGTYNLSLAEIKKNPQNKIELKTVSDYFEIGLAEVKDQSARLTGFLITTYNITDKIRNEKELEELNATKDKFFSIIAHDLKNPLFGLMGLSEILLNSELKAPDSMEDKEMIGRIHELSQNTYILLENLLQWARAQRGTIIKDTSEFSVSSLILTAANQFKQNAELKHIDLSVIEGPQCIVNADQNMIHTVLRNLISNAIKFTPAYGRVLISWQLDQDSVFISIKDTGTGMPESTLKNLFSLSKISVKGTNGETGTGLGLIVIKEFLDVHNGELSVSSSEGKGSEFTIRLPLK